MSSLIFVDFILIVWWVCIIIRKGYLLYLFFNCKLYIFFNFGLFYGIY